MDKILKTRRIIHCDMDAFYAAVEQRDNPALKGKPVVVGGRPNSRGVVSTASYEARKYGIRSAMSLYEAYRRCPEAVFLPVNGKKYREVSRRIHKIFFDYTPLVEPISLDEAFLDVTGSAVLFGSATSIAAEIKKRIKEELNLTASVGVAPNKFLAKIASDLRKPDGFTVVKPNEVQEFLSPLPVERLWGVGRKTAQRLHELNVKTVRDLCFMTGESLEKLFGVMGQQLYLLSRGIDERPVEVGRNIKSIGRETTFASDITETDLMETTLLELAIDVGRRLRKEALKARTVTIKVRFKDFQTLNRSKTMEDATDLDEDVYKAALELFYAIPLKQPVRLMGITLSSFDEGQDVQLSLFDNTKQHKQQLSQAVDAVKDKFGEQSITRARLLDSGTFKGKNPSMK